MNDKHTLQKRFQRLLLARLTARYGRVPTCSRLARDFSLIAADVAPISNETARKWLRGDVMPHASRLKILCTWLDIDFARMSASEPPATAGPALSMHSPFCRPAQHTDVPCCAGAAAA